MADESGGYAVFLSQNDTRFAIGSAVANLANLIRGLSDFQRRTMNATDFNTFCDNLAAVLQAAKREHAPAHFNEGMDDLAKVVTESKVKV